MSEHALSFDDKVTEKGRHVFPEGTIVQFEVTKTQFPVPVKFKGQDCQAFNMTLRATAPDGTEAEIMAQLKLWSTLEWIICDFFRSIGLRKHGEKGRPQWEQVEGKTGWARLSVRQFTGRNGGPVDINDVEKYLDPDDPSIPKQDEIQL